MIALQADSIVVPVDSVHECFLPAAKQQARDELIAALNGELTDSTSATSLIEGYQLYCVEDNATPRQYVMFLETTDAPEWTDRVDSILEDLMGVTA